MPDFTNQAGWEVQQLANLETSGGSTSPLLGSGGKANGLLVQTMDPDLATGTPPVATGTLVGVLTLITEPVKVSKFALETVSATVTFAACAVIDMNGNILASTADFHSTWAATTNLTPALSAAVTLAPGLYYLAVAAVGTSPTVAGTVPQAISNVNTAAASGNLRTATLATGITTALPSSPLTLTSASAVASAPCLGLL